MGHVLACGGSMPTTDWIVSASGVFVPMEQVGMLLGSRRQGPRHSTCM